MAKFNEEKVNMNLIDKNDFVIAGMNLQAMLTNKELEKLKRDWKSSGGYEKIPYWKFCFDNIKVSYE